MFVLQECSICFEDYDAERQPHSIPCGHVFCQPCLDSLVSTSPQCPNCRVSYASASIRKVICNLQDQDSSGPESAAQKSEAETLMWQAIESAVESPQDLKQCKSIVQNNPEDALLAAGMNKNVLTSLTLMRLLVQAEEKNGSLKDKLNTSWAVEESLRDQISRLEAKLSLAGTNTCPSSEHFKLLLADVHKLQSAVDVINKNTSEVARHLKAKSEPPEPQARPTEVPEGSPQELIPPLAPEPVIVPPLKKQPSRPGILRKPPPQDTNNSIAGSPVESPAASRISLGIGNPPRQDPSGPTHHRYPSTPTPRQLMSPPMTPAVLLEPLDGSQLFGQTSHINRRKSAGPSSNYPGIGGPSTAPPPYPQSPPMTRHLSIASVPTSNKTHMAHLSMPTPSVPISTTNSTFANPRPAPTPTPTQSPFSHSVNRTPLPATPIPPPTSTPKPQSRPRTLTAVFDFSAKSPTELSLRNGQKLYLLPESDTQQEWIWCRDENGKTGYAPKSYVTVDST
ncbi:hypothetical protein ACGC1H_004996 [Rhizoctonia solani]|uniref:SH3 domain-containing protein n=1 Tax=Rhizoctonia solani TaxID=456999 RepID=A0A8H3GBN9_9AGAM|nr:unnamed protein product [Rhizoctonia solani]